MTGEVNERPAWHLKEFDKPLLVAVHFGFLPIDAPKTSEQDIEDCRNLGSHPLYSAPEKAAFLRTYLEHGLSTLPHPLSVTYKRQRNYYLELVDFPEGLAEAVLMRTTLSMLAEVGHKRLVVDLNCIGDKDSICSYERELSNFLRRAGESLPTELKRELRRDVFALLNHPAPELKELRERAPTSIAFLSTQSRAYFKEVLEYIEALEIEFKLSPELVGEKSFCSHTIWNIKNANNDSDILAVGYSYHRLGRRFGLKKESRLAGATIFSAKPSDSRVYKELPMPKFYLVQLGREAKMRTLSVLELLRRERIAVHHLLGRDKLTGQLARAEDLRVPYLLIIGQKEALESTVTVRNVSTRAQDTVSLSVLPRFLKNLPI